MGGNLIVSWSGMGPSSVFVSGTNVKFTQLWFATSSALQCHLVMTFMIFWRTQCDESICPRERRQHATRFHGLWIKKFYRILQKTLKTIWFSLLEELEGCDQLSFEGQSQQKAGASGLLCIPCSKSHFVSGFQEKEKLGCPWRSMKVGFD